MSGHTPWFMRDSDRDGVTDAEEIQRGTDPEDPDSDGDGWPDGVDVAPLRPNVNNDPSGTGDYDGDGVANADEKIFGTDPFDPDTEGRGRGDRIVVDELIRLRAKFVNENGAYRFDAIALINELRQHGARPTHEERSRARSEALSLLQDPNILARERGYQALHESDGLPIPSSHSAEIDRFWSDMQDALVNRDLGAFSAVISATKGRPPTAPEIDAFAHPSDVTVLSDARQVALMGGDLTGRSPLGGLLDGLMKRALGADHGGSAPGTVPGRAGGASPTGSLPSGGGNGSVGDHAPSGRLSDDPNLPAPAHGRVPTGRDEGGSSPTAGADAPPATSDSGGPAQDDLPADSEQPAPADTTPSDVADSLGFTLDYLFPDQDESGSGSAARQPGSHIDDPTPQASDDGMTTVGGQDITRDSVTTDLPNGASQTCYRDGTTEITWSDGSTTTYSSSNDWQATSKPSDERVDPDAGDSGGGDATAPVRHTLGGDVVNPAVHVGSGAGRVVHVTAGPDVTPDADTGSTPSPHLHLGGDIVNPSIGLGGAPAPPPRGDVTRGGQPAT